MWLTSMVVGKLSDLATIEGHRQLMSVQTARRICNTVGFVGPALGLIALAYSGCDYVASAVFLCIAIGLNGAVYSGFQVKAFFLILKLS